MKKLMFFLTLLLSVALIAAPAPNLKYMLNSALNLSLGQNVKIYISQGGTTMTVASGGTLTVAGTINTTGTFKLSGTTVTSTAAELNALDGITSTVAELNILDGVTSTAAELNILDGVTSTTAELNILDTVTSTAAELNILDGVTKTTAEVNEVYITGEIADISSAASSWVVSPIAGTIGKIYTVIDGAVTVGDATVTFEIGGVAVTGGSITIAHSGSAAGVVDECTCTAANTVAAGGAIEIITDGGSTDAAKAVVILVITAT